MNVSSEFWKNLRDAQDEALEKLAYRQVVRQQMPLRAPSLSPEPRGRSRFLAWAGVGSAIALAASVALFFSLRSHPAMSFEVGDSHDAGVIGAWIASPDRAKLPLHFSDGTAVSLDPGTRVRVADTSPEGAHVVLERGRASANVIHRDHTKWRVDVGPFGVDVVGTAFTVSWDPVGEVLRLRLQEGQVVVSGAFLRQATRVSQGQTFRVFCKESRSELVEQVVSGNEPDPTLIPETVVETPAHLEVADAGELSRGPQGADPWALRRAKWLELATAGKYREALDLVERGGFENECSRASGRDLVTLGDVARFSGNANRARQAYQAARDKLPGGGRASFSLGLLAFNQQRDFGEAAKWFDVYLRDQPRGGLRREAMGRLLESWQRAGDQGKAAKIAQQYLLEYPTGAHAPLARQLTSQ